MPGNIKGITISFNGDTTKLDKALRTIKNSTKDIDKELKAVDKALKFNPTSVELWRQKQDLLKKKITETENNLKSLKDMQKQMDAQGVDKQSEAYRTVSREIIEAESKLKTFNNELRKIGNANVKALGEQFKAAGDKLTAAGNAMKGLSTAAAAVVASIGALTVKSAKWADDMNTMSKVYSIGTSELQTYAAAADLVDVSVETIAKSHVKLEKQMMSAKDGTGASAEAFEALGVSVTNADGSLRDGDAVWQDTIAALGQMENETERDALAMQLMGKSAAELNPLIEDGGKTYKDVSETLSKYGLDIIDQDTLDQANQFNDSLDMIKTIGMVTFQQLGTTLAGYLAPAMEKVVDLVGRIAEWLSQLSPETLAVIGTVATVVAVIAPLLLMLGKLATAINAIITIAPMVGTALSVMTGPFGLVVAAIAAVIAIGVAVYKNWDTIKAKAIELKDKVVATFNQVKAKVVSIWNGIKTAIMTPINTAVNAVKTAIDKIKRIINGAKLQLPKFKLPHFKISGGKLPWGIGGKGTAPKISVSWYKEGGIFDKASIIGVGEAGTEAAVPLDPFWAKMDKIVEAVQNGTGGGSPVINIYPTPNQSPRQIAIEVEKVLTNMQKQRNMAYGGI